MKKARLETFLPYLEELRVRIYGSTVFFCLIFCIGFFSSGFILKHILAVFDIQRVTIATTSPFQFANIAVDIGFFLALLCTIPIVIYDVYLFIKPALHPKEQTRFWLSIPVSFILFVSGFLYGFIILYYSFQILAAINIGFGIANIWDIGSLLSQIFITSSLLGIIFQFPLIISMALRIGIINLTFLKEKRRVSFFMIILLVSLLPPTDGISLLAMALPLVLLYEATLLINK